ncbi:putative Splicing factor U2af 38 kDa subunit [Paratrimastix pyriformis]|uniref:Splicing factor U2af 38 kDa subunit n=1 Tax=Paratrimastix pyriformis TaxID=342808 RepID=A0ABQ8UJR6_9EUKA|nr:putative Splicing factor U2af 38 kDa subunit [Paratrimastix pyriformis]
MAQKLAQIYGTEQDKVNCPFYFKMGACRHGDRCSRQHNRPLFSQSVLIQHMFNNPLAAIANMPNAAAQIDRKQVQQQFEDFYEDVYGELQKFGEIEELQVCDNLCEHLLGNVYVKFADEESATRCVQGLAGRFYGGRPILAELTPVTDFREARCRQYEMGQCDRGGVCNFLHLLDISSRLRKKLFGHSDSKRPSSRSRSRSRGRDDRRSRYGYGQDFHPRHHDSHESDRRSSRDKEAAERVEKEKDKADKPADPTTATATATAAPSGDSSASAPSERKHSRSPSPSAADDKRARRLGLCFNLLDRHSKKRGV